MFKNLLVVCLVAALACLAAPAVEASTSFSVTGWVTDVDPYCVWIGLDEDGSSSTWGDQMVIVLSSYLQGSCDIGGLRVGDLASVSGVALRQSDTGWNLKQEYRFRGTSYTCHSNCVPELED